MHLNMLSSRILTFAVVALVLGLLATSVVADSSYRKPPFNGSIFGKRGNTGNNNNNNNNVNAGDYEVGNSGKSLSSMCEIALEACQSWFPQDK